MTIHYDTKWIVIIHNQIIYKKFNTRIMVYLNNPRNWKCLQLSLQKSYNSWSRCIETELKCRLEMFLPEMQPSFQRTAICLARINSLIGSCNVEGGPCTAAKAFSWHWNTRLNIFCSKSSLKCSQVFKGQQLPSKKQLADWFLQCRGWSLHCS